MPVRSGGRVFRLTTSIFVTLCLLVISYAAVAQEEIELQYEKFVLDNGLTLIVHEDHKAPIVAVNVWYHVGSKNEEVGKTGFAHLFEHLMFNGSENYNDDYFQPMELVGATDMNGTTNNDRTNYFQNVPTSALDLTLWMESDRMGHLMGAIDQDKLDEQRGVVQNEKRQGENQPYGKVFKLIAENTFPAGHPYSWSVIGSMEDLNAASIEDVGEWFKGYYGAGNAILSIAGDVDTQAVKEKVEAYFGDIPSGPPIARYAAWIAKREGSRRQTMHDRVPLALVTKVWNIPQWGTAEMDYLDLFSDVLSSRLYKRLVYEDQIATRASASVFPREIAGQFFVQVYAKPGGDLAEVEKALDEELSKLIAKGPTRKELRRMKTQNYALFVRGLERIGGFGGTSDLLAMSEIYGGSPDQYRVSRARLRDATPRDLRDAARAWLTDGDYTLEVHPFPEFSAHDEGVDRSALPETTDPPRATFPTVERATLANGLEIILAERHAIPVVGFELIVDAGYAADHGDKAGRVRLAMATLLEGTRSREALEIGGTSKRLGADLDTSSSLDTASVSLSALKVNLEKSLDLFVDVILNPAFKQEEVERQREQLLARIRQQKSSPNAMGIRVIPALLFGKDHPYGGPGRGYGTEASVAEITRDDLIAFHEQWFKPNNAKLIVVGDTTLEEILPLLERGLSAWKRGEVPEKVVPAVSLRKEVAVYLMDRPGAAQSVIFAAHIAPPKRNPNEIPIATMNRILGGSFTSRINMNLREDKHWSYGSRSSFAATSGQRLFIVSAPVQTDKTKESLVELDKELRGIIGDRPVTDAELQKTMQNQILRLSGSWETSSAVRNSIGALLRFGLPDTYYDTYADKVAALTVADLQAAAKQVIHPDNLVWVIVGDLEKIEAGVRELGFGPVHKIDPDGNSVE